MPAATMRLIHILDLADKVVVMLAAENVVVVFMLITSHALLPVWAAFFVHLVAVCASLTGLVFMIAAVFAWLMGIVVCYLGCFMWVCGMLAPAEQDLAMLASKTVWIAMIPMGVVGWFMRGMLWVYGILAPGGHDGLEFGW